MSAEIDWRWADASGQQRLVRTDELRAALASGVIAPNTPVWRHGWKEWKPAYDVPELTTSALSAANGLIANIPPPPLAMVAVQRQFEGAPVAVHNKLETEPPPPPSYVPAPTRQAYGVFHTPSMPMQLHPVPAPRTSQPARSSQPASPPSPSSQSASHAKPGEVRVPPPQPMKNVMTTYEGPPPTPRPLAGSQTAITETAIPHVAREANTAVNLAHLSDDAKSAAASRGATARTVIGIPRLPHDAAPPSQPPTRRGGEDSVAGLDASRRSSIPGDPSRRSSMPGEPQYPSSAPIRIPTISLQSLTRPVPPPPMSSRPPPPVPPKSSPQVSGGASKPPPPPSTKMRSVGLVKEPEPKAASRASGPPRPNAGARFQAPGAANRATGANAKAGRTAKPDDDSIEELSGSILLPDQSGGYAPDGSGAYEELSGSMLLPDQSAQVPTASTSAEELSGSFLLDAGSTGALPSFEGRSPESTGAILAARVTEPNPEAAAHAIAAREAALPPAGYAAEHRPHVPSAGDPAETRVTEPSAVPAQLAATTRSVPSIGAGYTSNGLPAASAASAPSWTSNNPSNAETPPSGDVAHLAAATAPAPQPYAPHDHVQDARDTSNDVTAVEERYAPHTPEDRPSTRRVAGHGAAYHPQLHGAGSSHLGSSQGGPSQTGRMPALEPGVIPPPSPDVLAALSAIEASPAPPPADPGATAPHGSVDPHGATPYGPPVMLDGHPVHAPVHHQTLMGFAPPPVNAAPGQSGYPQTAAGAGQAPNPQAMNAYPAQHSGSGPASVRPSAYGAQGGANVPLPERSSARLHDMSSLLRPDMRKKLVIPALAGLGAVVMLGVIGLVIGAVRKHPSDGDTTAANGATSASAASSGESAASPTPQRALPPAASPNAPPPVPNACVVGGAAHVIAPRAVVQSGVEVQQVGTRVALGFASAPREGMAVAVDPTSLVATQTVRAHSPDPIRRLVPYATPRGLGAASDGDAKRDHLQGRRTIAAEPPFDLGGAFGALAWAPFRTEKISSIWPLEGEGAIEALRAAPLDPANRDAGWAITFRRGASIYAGVVTSAGGKALAPKGPLVKIEGLGPQVGSPSIAANGDAVLVAWADRASASDAWGVRWMRFAPGDASGDPRLFAVPAGGLGDSAMSPTLASAGLNRFVLVWTEGPVANHQVRAQTLSASGDAIGAPIAISGDGVNAGQAQMAILPDGHGVVAYLAAREPSGKTYEVMATPLTCP